MSSIALTQKVLHSVVRAVVGDTATYRSRWDNDGVSVHVPLHGTDRTVAGTPAANAHFALTNGGTRLSRMGYPVRRPGKEESAFREDVVIEFLTDSIGIHTWSWHPGEWVPRVDGAPVDPGSPEALLLDGRTLTLGPLERTETLWPLPTREGDLERLPEAVRACVDSIELGDLTKRDSRDGETRRPVTRLKLTIRNGRFTVNFPSWGDFVVLDDDGDPHTLAESMDLSMKFVAHGWAEGVTFSRDASRPGVVHRTTTIQPAVTVTAGQDNALHYTTTWDAPTYRRGNTTTRHWEGAPREAATFWDGYRKMTVTGGFLCISE